MGSTPPGDTRPDRSTLLAFVIVVVLGGTNAVAVKQTVLELAPFWGATMRFMLAGAILLAIVQLTGRGLPSGRSLAGAALYGAVGFAASYGCGYTALRDVPAGTAALLIAPGTALRLVRGRRSRHPRRRLRRVDPPASRPARQPAARMPARAGSRANSA